MRWKLALLIVFFACCPATVVSARPQSAGRGLSWIVVPTESEAVELRSRIKSGASFEALAVAYSVDPTAARAGYLGMVDESSLNKEFRTALKRLKSGEVSSPTSAGNSFVLLKWTTADEDRWRFQNDNALDALQQGRYPEAASLFLLAVHQAEKFGTQDVRLAESLNGLAQVYRYQRNFAGAEPKARQALAILERALGPAHSGVLPSLVNLAGITGATGRYGEAESIYRRMLSVRWGTPGVTGVSADQVLEKFAEVLSLDYSRYPGIGKALDDYLRSILESRLNKDLYLAMREKLTAIQLMVESESLMQRAVNVYPDSRQLYYQLGELYVVWGKYQKAIGAFESAARHGANPNDEVESQQRSLIHERIGEMNFYLVQFDESVAALQSALEINPTSPSARLLLGALYLRRNRFDEAAAEYERVVSANPRIAAAHEGLAQVELARDHFADSAREADRAIFIDPGLQSARYLKAMALIRSGREEEGKVVLQEYQRRDDEQQPAKAQMTAIAELERASSALLAESRAQEAIALLREGIKAHPLNAALYLKLGMIQSRLQLHREAVETFETMILLKLDDFLVHRQLAREYEMLGNKDGGQQQRVLYLQKYDAALQTKAN